VADGIYGVYQPYDDPGDDLLAQMAQLSIFFSLVASIVTNAYPNDPVMSALLPLFLAVPIALMVLSELELLKRFKRLMEPDEDGNVQWIGRIVLHVCRMANSQIERVCSTSGRGEVSKAERDERLKVLVSAKALRREPSERRKTSVTKGSNTRPGLSQGMQDLNDAVSSAPKAAPNAAATSSNVAATDAGEMAAMDAQARPLKGSDSTCTGGNGVAANHGITRVR
jgi:hypothetical protein